MRLPILTIAVLLGACTGPVPDDLARTVLLDQIGQIDGIDEGFVLCVAANGQDVAAETLAALRHKYEPVVPRSECEWVMDTAKGSFHKPTGRRAMLVDVFNYERRGRVEFEARFHGRWATMKTLEVHQDASGWRTVRVVKHLLAHAEQAFAGDARNARA